MMRSALLPTVAHCSRGSLILSAQARAVMASVPVTCRIAADRIIHQQSRLVAHTAALGATERGAQSFAHVLAVDDSEAY